MPRPTNTHTPIRNRLHKHAVGAKQMLRFVPHKLTVSLCALLAGGFFSVGAWATASPDSIAGTTLVTAEGFINLVEKIPDLTIIDSRIPGDRKQGFVEGSLSLPDVDTTCESLTKLISKKDSASLFYCNGVKCGRSAKAVTIALGCGYSNIYWFRGGFEEWLEKGYPYLQE
jgi:rhodanese-related sulfurtransferase